MVRPAIVAIFMIALGTSSQADIYSDCKQSANQERTLHGCTEIIKRGKRESRFNRAFAYNKRGMYHADRGQLLKAISEYTKAIRIDPRYADSYNNRGAAYGELGQIDRAIADHTKAIEVDPNFDMAYNNRGYAYRQKEQYIRAIRDYSNAIKINPSLTIAYINRGIAYLNTGNKSKAVADWRTAHTLGDQKATHNLKVLGIIVE